METEENAQVDLLVSGVVEFVSRNGIRDPVDDVEEDKSEREELSRHFVDAARSEFARLDIYGRRVGHARMATLIQQGLQQHDNRQQR